MWWSGATRREIPYWAEAGRFAQAPLGWILHVAVGNGSLYPYFSKLKSPHRKFSHLWFAKDGRVEQYGPLNYKSWAQGDGNGQYWSCETEGFPAEPLTAAQIEALTAFHVFSGTLNQAAEKPGDRGIGTHYMGGRTWGAHSCPDPGGREGKGPRSTARALIIARAGVRATRPLPEVDMPLEPADARTLWEFQYKWGAEVASPIQLLREAVNILRVEARENPPPIDYDALAAAVAARLPQATGALSVDAIRAAVADVLTHGTDAIPHTTTGA